MTPRRRDADRRIDWSDLLRRVEAAGRALDVGAALPEERVASLLDERARLLARPVATGSEAQAPNLISFSVAGEAYGVEPRRVLEVCRSGHITPLPPSEPWIVGLVGWRGELVLAIDLRVLLGAAPAPRPEQPTLVVLGSGKPQVGILADAPGDLLLLPAESLRPPPEALTGAAYLRGMTAEAVLVLDVDRVLEAVGPDAA